MTDEKTPIFFAWTRSFWGAIVTALLTFSETDDATAHAVGAFIGSALGQDAEAWGATFSRLPPVLALAFVVHQRSGAARPYTINPKADGALS